MSTPPVTSRAGIAAEIERRVRKQPRGIWLWVWVAVAIACGVLMFVVTDKTLIGWAGLVMMLALIFLRVPVAIALIAPGLLGLWAMRGFRSVAGLLTTLPYDETATWTLSVIPMFILLGMLIWSTGSMNHLYTAARAMLWRVPGGIAVGTMLAGSGMAAATGNSLAAAYSLGGVAVPEMLRSGYDRRVATLSLLSIGMTGQLFPTSVLLVIYAGVAEIAVGPQLLAGLIPALVVAAVFALVFVLIALIWPARGGGSKAARSSGRLPAREVTVALLKSWPIAVVMVVIVGGLLTGLFTATEAGAVAATVMFVVALVIFTRARNFRPLGTSLINTISTTGMIFLLLIGAHVLSAMLIQANIAAGFTEWVVAADLNRVEFLFLMAAVYIILGTGLDTLAMMLLTLPVILPSLEVLDVSLLWFGVFIVLMGEIASISPPVGVLLYAIHNLLQDKEINLGIRISLKDVFVSTAYVLPGALIVVAVLIFWPDLATWLPSLMAQQ